ncbi:MAG: hypothetical protein HC895_04655 [Leptolyngbyaceae cyanobacterium SM1_3_5]|nr:hypothetical protein [Leptolyngbyaceae cyanobacterium SM1_3_5]
MVASIGNLQIRDDVRVTIAGTIAGIREDEFCCKINTGQVWVDPGRSGSGWQVGERVTVTGEFDDAEDFDATQIIRSSVVQPTPNPRPGNNRPGNRPIAGSPPLTNIRDLQVRDDVLVTIRGRVTRIREDEFLLRDATGQVWVDAFDGPANFRRLRVGDRVRVVGDFDDADFDARRITRIGRSPRPNRSIEGDSRNSAAAGSPADQVIRGTDDIDSLNGRSGDDVLVGGQGRDRLTGGAGRDRFRYESLRDAGDVMTDFSPANDAIDLSAIFDRLAMAAPIALRTTWNYNKLSRAQSFALIPMAILAVPDFDRSPRLLESMPTRSQATTSSFKPTLGCHFLGHGRFADFV